MAARTKACPRCKEILTRFSVFGVDLDQCPKCRGLWFDASELELVKNNMDDDVRWKHIDLEGYAERAHFKHSKLACPACGAALCELLFDSTKIELEFCARCHGVWADEGKLTPILNHMRGVVAVEPLNQIERETFHQFLEIFVGRKGPWEEFKNFAAAWRMLALRFAIDHPALTARLETARRALPF